MLEIHPSLGENMVKKTENLGLKKELEEIDFKTMQANFSALLYVITEQQAIIGKLLQELLAIGAINSQQLKNITDIYGNKEVLSPVYADLYKRFAWYYLRVKETVENMDQTNPSSKDITDQEKNND